MSETTHGLQFPESKKPPLTYFSVNSATDLAVAALDSMGLVANKNHATETIGQHMQALYDSISETRHDYGAEVDPFVSIDLTEKFGLYALINAYNKNQKRGFSSISGDCWRQYSASELNSRQIGAKPSSPSGVSISARAMILVDSANDYEDLGLHYNNTGLNELEEELGEKQLINPADYVLLDAQRREADIPRLGKSRVGTKDLDLGAGYVTRFPQLKTKPTDAVPDSWVPHMLQAGGFLCLSAMDADDNSPRSDIGVRLSVG